MTATEIDVKSPCKKSANIRINKEQKLYVIPVHEGFTTLGFKRAETLRKRMLKWVDGTDIPARAGTAEAWLAYQLAKMKAQAKHQETGEKCPAELTPKLIGKEGKRVEIYDKDDTFKRSFTVSRSAGWLPCHIEMEVRHADPEMDDPEEDGIGGFPACLLPGDRVVVVSH